MKSYNALVCLALIGAGHIQAMNWPRAEDVIRESRRTDRRIMLACNCFVIAAGIMASRDVYRVIQGLKYAFLQDPEAIKALAMLNAASCKDQKISFKSIDYCRSAGVSIEDAEHEFTDPKALYKWLKRTREDSWKVDLAKKPASNVRICTGDSCVDVKSINTRGYLEEFLKRVDSAEAPVLGIEAPGLRRLINRVTNP